MRSKSMHSIGNARRHTCLRREPLIPRTKTEKIDSKSTPKPTPTPQEQNLLRNKSAAQRYILANRLQKGSSVSLTPSKSQTNRLKIRDATALLGNQLQKSKFSDLLRFPEQRWVPQRTADNSPTRLGTGWDRTLRNSIATPSPRSPSRCSWRLARYAWAPRSVLVP